MWLILLYDFNWEFLGKTLWFAKISDEKYFHWNKKKNLDAVRIISPLMREVNLAMIFLSHFSIESMWCC